MSPRKKEDNELIKEQRKQQILDVALRLFANVGYESTSISRIAKEAGISKGLIYNYFESKEDLLKNLVLSLNSMEEDYREEIMDDDPKIMLKNIFTSYFKILIEQKDQLRLISALAFQIDKFDFLQDMATNKLESYTQMFTGLLEQIGIENPKEESLLIGALFDGIATQYLIIHNDYPLKTFENYLIKKYCNN